MFHATTITKPWQICKVKKWAQRQIAIFFNKSVHKNTHFQMAKPTPHTWVSFLGQVSMRNYSSSYLLTHTIIPKGIQFFFKNILELPLISFKEEPPWIAKAKNQNTRKFCRIFNNKYISEKWKNIDWPFFECLPTSPWTTKGYSTLRALKACWNSFKKVLKFLQQFFFPFYCSFLIYFSSFICEG
jgi:hypothetical protein